MIENIKAIILAKAMELFKQNGFDNVTINEICESCGITKRTFYYHYESKKTLLLDYFSVFEENIENTLKKIEQEKSWLQKCWRIKEIYISGITALTPDILGKLITIDMEQQNKLFDIKLNDYDPIAKTMRQLVIDYTKKGQAAGEINSITTAEDLSYCFASAFLGLAVNWSSTNGSFNLLEASKNYFNVIYQSNSLHLL